VVYMLLLTILTGFDAVYIGSSINIGIRLVQHLVINNTNKRLQRAFNKYGLENFTFCVVELYGVNPEVSLKTNRDLLLDRGGKTEIP